VKRGDGEEEEDADAAAALPHVVALVGVPSVYCCGGVYGERSVCCCGGAEESKGGDVEEEKDGDAAAALPHAVALVDVPSVYSCSGAEERRGCDGAAAATVSHAVALRSTTGFSHRNRDSRPSSPELSFKTEGVSKRTLTSFTQYSLVYIPISKEASPTSIFGRILSKQARSEKGAAER
jgi:hypothetical protein